MDPNTWKLVPDPEFWSNLDLEPGPDPDSRLRYDINFKRKNFKIVLEKKTFLEKKLFF